MEGARHEGRCRRRGKPNGRCPFSASLYPSITLHHPHAGQRQSNTSHAAFDMDPTTCLVDARNPLAALSESGLTCRNQSSPYSE